MGLRMIPLLAALALGTVANACDQANRTVLIMGDSISAARGVEPAAAWTRLLAERLASQGGWQVVNASISGETTGGGLQRLPGLLGRHCPGIVVLELGGNDGLRGYPIETIRDNLERMARIARAAGARVILAGMHVPPNYGPRYARAFHGMYLDLAQRLGVALVPFLLEGIATHPELMQPDGIHPRASAQRRILDNLWPVLAPFLDEPRQAASQPHRGPWSRQGPPSR